MQNIFTIFKEEGFQSPQITRWQALYSRLFDSRWTIAALIGLGIVRVLFFLAAYAPADGADAHDYYAYAAFMNGIDLPNRVANVSPIYPFFIYVNHYVLGNLNLIIVWQMGMSASLGLIYYLGLRRYNALLAILVALMVIADAQTGIAFNFVSTEPLYLFLLACVYSLTLIQNQTVAKRALQIRDVVLGVLLVLLRETRTVARYAFVPVLILFAVASRDWKRVLVILVSFGLVVQFVNMTTRVTQTEEVVTDSDIMLLRPLVTYGLLDAEAGTASTDLGAAVDSCAESDLRLFPCLEAYFGDDQATMDVINQAYVESISQRPLHIYRRMFEQFTDFLKLSGRQVYGSPTPAEVQCADVPARIERNIQRTFDEDWADLVVTDTQRAAYHAVMTDFTQQMCPPLPTNATAKRITDWLSFRYRSLSRTHPYVWYLPLIVLVLIIPWARKLWLPIFLAGGLLAYHAAISAALFNVQPRYAMVTNPFKGLLLLALSVILAYVTLKYIDNRLSSTPE